MNPMKELSHVVIWERVDADRGEVLCRPGDPFDALYLVRSGKVEIVSSGGSRGRRKSRVLGPGEFFGELDFSHPIASRVTVRALEDTALLRIDGRGLVHKLKQQRGGKTLHIKQILGCGDRLVFVC
jgi:CRP/FNR family transcriptional regulator